MSRGSRVDDKTSENLSISTPDDGDRSDLQLTKKSAYALANNPETTLVGANLPTRYARNVAFVHAEIGKSKKEIIQEALDMYFTAIGAVHRNLKARFHLS